MMGVPKQKWTSEEEAALRAGVKKYGPGKWRAIQRDPNFGPCLVSRSNVDLKDKWRNMNVGAYGHGHSRAKRIKKVMEEEVSVKPLAIMPAEDATDTAAVVQAVSGNGTERRSLGSRGSTKSVGSEGTSTPTFLRDMPRRMRGDVGSKKPDMDFELARSKIRTADEAGIAAALAITEAEAAAAAAQETVMEADDAEEEAKLAETTAYAMYLSGRRDKKCGIFAQYIRQKQLQ